MADELAAQRFRKKEDAAQTTPSEMLNKVLIDIERGEFVPDHVMVISCKRLEDGAVSYRRYQAGDFNYLERIGLLQTVKVDEAEERL